jgi:tRNA(Ile2) C34 agmatinyltransferase TiaS
MACPTCDQEMEEVGDGVFWCPQCGTLKEVLAKSLKSISIPTLVSRVRRMREKHNYGVDVDGPTLERLERDVDDIARRDE